MDANALYTVLDMASIVFLALAVLAIAVATFLPSEKRTAILRQLVKKGSSF